MIQFPCAKINLGLNVVERRSDGYHNLETVFLPVPVTDAIEIHEMSDSFPLNNPCSLKVTGTTELCDEQSNLVVKAYNLLKNDFNLPRLFVHLHKQIPSQAGMGGGSSDASFMIKLLNEQFSLGLDAEAMRSYAVKLGADCPFFITANPKEMIPYYATGIGEKLTAFDAPLTQLTGKWLLLVKPNVAVSTKEAYAGVTPCKPKANCKDVLLNAPINEWKELLTNDFEKSVFAKLPVLADVKQTMYANGAEYASMSGSGSTIFGIFNDKPNISKWQKEPDTWIEICKL